MRSTNVPTVITMAVVLVPYVVDPFSILVPNTDRTCCCTTTGGGNGTIRRMAHPQGSRRSSTLGITESWRSNSTRIDTGVDDDTMASILSLQSSSTEQQQTSRHMLLLSLRWSELVDHGGSSSSSNSNESFSKIVYDIWKWKDLVLGDGRDYFLPKSNTLRALQNYMIHNANYCRGATLMPNNNIGYTVSECVILSNCARFEIMLVVDTAATMTVDKTTFRQQLLDRVVSDVSMLLHAQAQSHLQNRRDNLNLFAASTSFLDRPNDIDMNAMIKILQPNGCENSDFARQIQGVPKHWHVLSNVTDIISHLCAITVGIASRPRRPDRIVPFRPFSSRDAHILLQFKRTTDIATFATKQGVSDENTSNNRLLLLLQYAIRAGKAARNPQRVPLLNTLRQHYGETGNSNKYDMVPPAHVMEQVLQSVHELVIHPTIHECVCHFNTMMESSTTKRRIQSLRHGALAIATTREERHYILTQLHGPTMDLRRQELSDQEYGSNVERRTPLVWNETEFLEELRWNVTAIRGRHLEKVPGT